MPVKSYLLGPGSLTLGAGVDLIQAATQVRSMVVRATEKVSSTEAIPVLSGDELEGAEDVDFDYLLVGNLIQDIDSDGLTDWTWEHKGEQHPFAFVPSTAKGRKATGVVSIVPVEFGGDVDKTKRPEAPISWRIIGEPALGTVAP